MAQVGDVSWQDPALAAAAIIEECCVAAHVGKFGVSSCLCLPACSSCSGAVPVTACTAYAAGHHNCISWTIMAALAAVLQPVEGLSSTGCIVQALQAGAPDTSDAPEPA